MEKKLERKSSGNSGIDEARSLRSAVQRAFEVLARQEAEIQRLERTLAAAQTKNSVASGTVRQLHRELDARSAASERKAQAAALEAGNRACEEEARTRTNQELDRLRRENETLAAEKAAIIEVLTRARSRYDSLVADRQRLFDELRLATEQLKNANAELASLKEPDGAEARQKLDAERERLAELGRELVAEVECVKMVHPLRDYLRFTESKLAQIELELQSLAPLAPGRQGLEKARRQLAEQRDFLGKTLASAEARVDELAARIRKKSHLKKMLAGY